MGLDDAAAGLTARSMRHFGRSGDTAAGPLSATRKEGIFDEHPA